MNRLLCAASVAIGVVTLITCKATDITRVRPGTVFVAARDSFFTPDTIRVTVGVPVRWTNEGTVYHAVVSDSALWSSNLLAPTWWFEVRFDSAGTFPYHCSQHAAMIGTVIVAP
ncbi:MAG TPA: cupredoxin domain-containing protein [Gemmatimonadales bacterium]|nr:cupredoxin domain-containing protein [Gemmatimonadales bacterium]